MRSALLSLNLVLNSLLPALVLFATFLYSLYFAVSRRRYVVVTISLIFLIGSLHQVAEVRTWLRTGRVPSPDWILGDFSETLVYGLTVVAFALFVVYFDRNRQLIDEKERLLDEVNHRMKNNLQMIESLLSYRKNRSDNPRTSLLLEQVQNRLSSFSLLYDKLHKTRGYEVVNMRDYLNDLCRVFETFSTSDEAIEITTEIDSLELPVDQVVASGLIVNELISNSIQHGEPENSVLEINLAFTSNAGYELMVRDNSSNFTSDAFEHSEGGFSLVSDIVKFDLNGSLEIGDTNGMQARITFPH